MKKCKVFNMSCLNRHTYTVVPYLPPIFCHPHLTAMVFHLQKFNSHYISCLISPSFIHHPHHPPTFSQKNPEKDYRLIISETIHEFINVQQNISSRTMIDSFRWGFTLVITISAAHCIWLEYPFHR